MTTQSSSSVRFRVLAASALFLTAGIAQARGDNEFAKLESGDGANRDDFGIAVAVSGTTAIVGANSHDHTPSGPSSAYLYDTTTGLELAELLPIGGSPGDDFGVSIAISGTTAIIGAMRDDENGSQSGAAYLFDTTTGSQIAKLLPDDGAANDWFGRSVAINGTMAIVGAPGPLSSSLVVEGSAYLFDTTTGLQVAKLLASDGAIGDFFGTSVAISGTTAIVGAYRDSDFGIWSGSAYLFDTTTGLQVAKLLPSDSDAREQFGYSVGISGLTAIVGARGGYDNGGISTGSAFLFDTTTGLQTAKLLANDRTSGDYFGYSVAISGTTAIVGASLVDDIGDDSGSAYFFDTTTGLQIEKLLPSDGLPGQQFGTSVAISGASACVGAPFFDDEFFILTPGYAYLFDAPAPVSSVGRGEMAKLLASDGAALDEFGNSVGLSGTTAIVGAEDEDDNGVQSGSAYLFDTTTDAQVGKLLASDGAAGDQFGFSVGLIGTTAIVGAYQDDDNGIRSGSAYLFDTATKMQTAKLLPNDGAAGEEFGYSVAVSGTTAIVGADKDNDNGTWSGSAYLFDTATGLQTAKLLPDDGATSDNFGFSVAVSGTTAIVGAIGDDDNGNASGSAYLFDTTTGLQIAKLLPSDGAPSNSFGVSVAISGTTAIVGAQGGGDNGNGAGSAYLFDTTTGLQTAKLLAVDGASSDQLGHSVAISGTLAIVSAWSDSDNGLSSGSAYLFDTSTGLQVAKLLPSDGAILDRFGSSVAISGSTAIVGARGDDDQGNESGSAYRFDASMPLLVNGDTLVISLIFGGSQVLTLEGRLERAGWFYFMFGSVTGTTPGIDFGGGVALPLNVDAYFNLTLTKPGLGLFGSFRGVLDGNGDAVASLSLPANMDPSLVGVTLNHACLAAAVFGVAPFVASNAVPVVLVP